MNMGLELLQVLQVAVFLKMIRSKLKVYSRDIYNHTVYYAILENDCFLKCCAVKSGSSLPTVQSCFLPPSKGPQESMSFCQNTWHNYLEDGHLHSRCRKIIISHLCSACWLTSCVVNIRGWLVVITNIIIISSVRTRDTFNQCCS